MSQFSLDHHFEGRSLEVRRIYDAILAASNKFGKVGVEPKKTSIHLTHKTAYAGIATRREFLILTIKSDRDIKSDRIFKREQTSANRWHHEIKLDSAKDVDAELINWLNKAYFLSA